MKKYLKHLFLLGSSSALLMIILYKSNFLSEQNELPQAPNRSEVSKSSLNEMKSEEYNNLSNALTGNQEVITEDLQSKPSDIEPEEKPKRLLDGLVTPEKKQKALEASKKYQSAESNTTRVMGSAGDLRRFPAYKPTPLIYEYKPLTLNKIPELKPITYKKLESKELKDESTFQGNWNDNEINKFKNDCLRDLEDTNSQLSNNERKAYCDCTFEKTISKYPDKHQTAEIEFLMEIAKECIPSN